MTTTIYHNPRCSKSREVLALLRERGIEPAVVEYLKTPPDAATLTQLLSMLRIAPRELLRRQEQEYAALGLADPGLDDDALIAAMVAHPKLIERPIVVVNGRAVVARPSEKLLDILK